LLVPGRLHEDLQVLAHTRLGRRRNSSLEVGRDALEVRFEPRVVARGQVRNMGVVAVDADRGGPLGRVLRNHLEQRLRIGIALRQPVVGRLARARRRHGQQGDADVQGSSHGQHPGV
jgi:hypothetical protein